MLGIEVNPYSVRPGGKIATKTQETADGLIRIIKSREIKRVSPCATSPEAVHLDHECYDTRFSTVVVPA